MKLLEKAGVGVAPSVDLGKRAVRFSYASLMGRKDTVTRFGVFVLDAAVSGSGERYFADKARCLKFLCRIARGDRPIRGRPRNRQGTRRPS